MHELFGINFWISNSVMVVWTHSGNGLYAYALPNGNNNKGYRNIRHSILLQFYFPLHPITSSIHSILEWNLSPQVAGTLCKFFPGTIRFLPTPHLAEDLEASTKLPPLQKTIPDIYIPPHSPLPLPP